MKLHNNLGYLDKLPHKKIFKNEESHQIIENLSNMIVYPLSLTPNEEDNQREDIQKEEN